MIVGKRDHEVIALFDRLRPCPHQVGENFSGGAIESKTRLERHKSRNRNRRQNTKNSKPHDQFGHCKSAICRPVLFKYPRIQRIKILKHCDAKFLYLTFSRNCTQPRSSIPQEIYQSAQFRHVPNHLISKRSCPSEKSRTCATRPEMYQKCKGDKSG